LVDPVHVTVTRSRAVAKPAAAKHDHRTFRPAFQLGFQVLRSYEMSTDSRFCAVVNMKLGGSLLLMIIFWIPLFFVPALRLFVYWYNLLRSENKLRTKEGPLPLVLLVTVYHHHLSPKMERVLSLFLFLQLPCLKI